MTSSDNDSDTSSGKAVLPRTVQVIVNPAAGTEDPILAELNRAFKEGGQEWEISITKQAGDARRFAQEAAQAGVDLVIACGGDGTVMETASGLRGTGVPLAILPQGTANVLSLELGIPDALTEALALITGGANTLRNVDMATVNDHEFILRVGIGMEARMILETEREAKNRLGNLAYVISGLSQLTNMENAAYTIRLDGQEIVEEGVTLFIANSMNMGLSGAQLVTTANVSDGLLDVVLIRRGNIPALVSIAASTLLNRADTPEPILQWQAREVYVRAEPQQPAEVDGEEIVAVEFHAKILPKAVSVLCPVPEKKE